MAVHAQLADGTTLEFPDGTDPSVIDRVVKTHIGTPAPKADNSRARGLALGVSEPFENIARGVQNLLPASLKAASDAQDRAHGSQTPDEILSGLLTARKANTRTGYQTAGNIIGTAPTALAKGGLAVQGAVQGALLSRSRDAGGIAADAGIGAASSIVGGTAVRAIGKAISPTVTPIVKRLLDQGVSLTPGQILGAGGSYVGKIAKGIEDKLTGFPIVGDAIGAARDRGNQSFNAAAINRALRPIGEKLQNGIQSGRDAITQAGDKLSAAYDAVVPRLSAALDSDFGKAFQGIQSEAKTLHPDRAKQFASIIDNDISRHFDANGNIDGAGLKQVESKLGERIRDTANSPDSDQRQMGRLLQKVQGAVRDMAARQNPQDAATLANINRGYANLVRVEKAAATAKDGVFSPAQLAAAARSGVGRKAAARGSGLMADFADDARSVLPSGTGDSGTAGRGSLAMVAGGVLGLPAVGVSAAAALPYTRVGQRIATAALTGRQGQVPQYLARLTASGARPVSIAAPALLRRPDE